MKTRREANKYAGKRVAIQAICSLYAFEEKLLGVIGINSAFFFSLPLSRWLTSPFLRRAGHWDNGNKKSEIARKERYGTVRERLNGAKKRIEVSNVRWMRWTIWRERTSSRIMSRRFGLRPFAIRESSTFMVFSTVPKSISSFEVGKLTISQSRHGTTSGLQTDFLESLKSPVLTVV